VHGVPANLDLRRFQDATLLQVGLGEYQIQFHFSDKTYLGIEGDWELRDSSGVLIDGASPNDTRTQYRVHVLLGRRVTKTAVSAPRYFALTFETGHELRVFDNSAHYESFSIQPGDVFV
jgi:Family of unknown function (DUF6188)